jgi:hypothetical protein
MPKGWVYVDDDMEKIRVKEARDDIEIARLQREGILPAKFELAEATHIPRVLKNEKKAMRSSRGPRTEINGQVVQIVSWPSMWQLTRGGDEALRTTSFATPDHRLEDVRIFVDEA